MLHINLVPSPIIFGLGRRAFGDLYIYLPGGRFAIHHSHLYFTYGSRLKNTVRPCGTGGRRTKDRAKTRTGRLGNQIFFLGSRDRDYRGLFLTSHNTTRAHVSDQEETCVHGISRKHLRKRKLHLRPYSFLQLPDRKSVV